MINPILTKNTIVALTFRWNAVSTKPRQVEAQPPKPHGTTQKIFLPSTGTTDRKNSEQNERNGTERILPTFVSHIRRIRETHTYNNSRNYHKTSLNKR
ncbi:unnamed protein product, partial [Nesidiocoris tenuis]